jgi:hypothetical protein
MEDADAFFAELDREDAKWEDTQYWYCHQQKKIYTKQENGRINTMMNFLKGLKKN